MNTKITLNKAAGRMSDITGLSLRKAEDLLRGLADIITEELADGETIKIKGLGTFKTIHVEARKSVNIASGEPNEIAEHTKVVFIPCKELATEVNSPFEFFETVELDDNVSEEELDAVEEEDWTAGSDKREEYDIESSDREISDSIEENYLENSDSSEGPESEIYGTENAEESKIAETESHESESMIADPVESETDAIGDEGLLHNSDISAETPDGMARPILNETVEHEMEHHTHFIDDDKNTKGKKRFRFGWGFIAGFAACLVAVAIGMGFAFAMMLGKLPWQKTKAPEAEDLVTEVLVINSEDNVVNTEPLSGHQTVTSASVKTDVDETDIPTEASDSQNTDKEEVGPVYDTITKTRYLTTMAKDHYGDFNLWPYIYEENKAFLGHPDRIKPGTKVVIPPLSKYGVKKTPEDIAKAKQLGAEIYGRYQ